MYGDYNYPVYNPNAIFNSTLNRVATGVPKVTGYEGAKAYPLGPNQSVALFDSNDNIFFLKTTDSAGFASYKTFRFTEIEQEQSAPTTVTRKEFDELKSMVQGIIDSGKGVE